MSIFGFKAAYFADLRFLSYTISILGLNFSCFDNSIFLPTV